MRQGLKFIIVHLDMQFFRHYQLERITTYLYSSLLCQDYSTGESEPCPLQEGEAHCRQQRAQCRERYRKTDFKRNRRNYPLGSVSLPFPLLYFWYLRGMGRPRKVHASSFRLSLQGKRQDERSMQRSPSWGRLGTPAGVAFSTPSCILSVLTMLRHPVVTMRRWRRRNEKPGVKGSIRSQGTESRANRVSGKIQGE